MYVRICIYYITLLSSQKQESLTPYIHLGYYLRTNSHQQHHWEHEAGPGHVSGGITAPIAFLLLEKHCWHRELIALEAALKCLGTLTYHHQLPSLEHPHTRKPSHGVQPTAPLAQRATSGCSSPCSGTSQRWGNKLSLPSELWVCLGAAVTPLHQARVWVVLVSARGRYYHIRKYPICTLQFHCAFIFTTVTCGIWDRAL